MGCYFREVGEGLVEKVTFEKRPPLSLVHFHKQVLGSGI